MNMERNWETCVERHTHTHTTTTSTTFKTLGSEGRRNHSDSSQFSYAPLRLWRHLQSWPTVDWHGSVSRHQSLSPWWPEPPDDFNWANTTVRSIRTRKLDFLSSCLSGGEGGGPSWKRAEEEGEEEGAADGGGIYFKLLCFDFVSVRFDWAEVWFRDRKKKSESEKTEVTENFHTKPLSISVV